MVGSSEHSNELLCSVKARECLDYLNDYWLSRLILFHGVGLLVVAELPQYVFLFPFSVVLMNNIDI